MKKIMLLTFVLSTISLVIADEITFQTIPLSTEAYSQDDPLGVSALKLLVDRTNETNLAEIPFFGEWYYEDVPVPVLQAPGYFFEENWYIYLDNGTTNEQGQANGDWAIAEEVDPDATRLTFTYNNQTFYANRILTNQGYTLGSQTNIALLSTNSVHGNTLIQGSIVQGFDVVNRSKKVGPYSASYGLAIATERYSHAEGGGVEDWHTNTFGAVITTTTAAAPYSHAEGSHTYACGNRAHAEGQLTTAYGKSSHAEGDNTVAYGRSAHAEGFRTVALAPTTHTEGTNTYAKGSCSHAEGFSSTLCPTSTWRGVSEAQLVQLWRTNESPFSISFGFASHVEGADCMTVKKFSHAEGSRTITLGAWSHSEGSNTCAYGESSHIEGSSSRIAPTNCLKSASETAIIEAWTESLFSMALGVAAHVEGGNNLALKNFTHAEGYKTVAQGLHSHAEGYNTRAIGLRSHAEGQDTITYGQCCHAEGLGGIATNNYCHVEGYNTEGTQYYSHSEGYGSVAGNNRIREQATLTSTSVGYVSHAEGTWAYGNSSHSEGKGTTAFGLGSHAQGYGSRTLLSDCFVYFTGSGTAYTSSIDHAL